METWDAIRARRNVREYTEQPIAEADLQRVLEAGWRASSAGNSQPWNFVVVTDRPQLVELAKVWQGARHIPGSAATIGLVVHQAEDARQRDMLMYDLGQTTANIMLAAADLGIGSGHAAVSDQEQARLVLGFPDGYFCAYLIGLGYPADRPLRPVVRPVRRPIEEVVHWERW
ncbi:MAG TPA: nitroreductase family protein [Microlunatus sp.]|nr:nitroreductase family protein [Microlunatus sp.]